MKIIPTIIAFALMLCANGQDLPTFRIIAPQNLCNSSAGNSTNPMAVTVSFQPRDGIKLTYRVRIFFKILGGEKISQRETLLIWKAVRTLEQRINILDRKQISMNNMAFINQSEVVSGVSYIFHVVGITDGGEVTNEEVFNLKYLDGTLQNEDVPTGINLILIGSDVTISNLMYSIYAKVSFCDEKRNYYIQWNIYYLNEEYQDLKKTIGNKITFPRNSFLMDRNKNNQNRPLIEAIVFDAYSSKQLAKDSMQVTIVSRGFQVYVLPTYACIGINKPLSVQLYFVNFDESTDNLLIIWEYVSLDSISHEPVRIQSDDPKILITFPISGRFQITATIYQSGISTKVSIDVEVIPTLPLAFDFVSIPNLYHSSNEKFEFKVLVIGLFSSCKAGWKSIKEDGYEYIEENEISEESFGKIIVSDSAEKYLAEISEIQNTTVTREIVLNIPPPRPDNNRWKGLLGDMKYKFCLEAVCPIQKDLSTPITVTTSKFEFTLNTNAPPKIGTIQIKPSTGHALITIFKVSTSSAKDLLFHTPLSYELFGHFDNHTLSFGKYLEYKAWDIILPYTKLPIHLSIVICDNQNACNTTSHANINVEYIQIELKEFNNLKSDIKNAFSRTNFHDGYNLILTTLLTFQHANSPYLNNFKEFILLLINKEIDKFLEINNINNFISEDDVIDFVMKANEIFEMIQVKDVNVLNNLLEILEETRFEFLISNGTGSKKTELKNTKQSNHHSKWNIDSLPSIQLKYIKLKIFLIEEIFKIQFNNNTVNGIKFLEYVNSLVKNMCYNNFITIADIETSMTALKIEKVYGISLKNKEIILTNHILNNNGYFKVLDSEGISDYNMYCLVFLHHPFDYFTNDNHILTQIRILDLTKTTNTKEFINDNELNIEMPTYYIKLPKQSISENKCSVRSENDWTSQFCKVIASTDKYLVCLCKKLGYFRHLALQSQNSVTTEESLLHKFTTTTFENEDIETVTTHSGYTLDANDFDGRISTMAGLKIGNEISTTSPKDQRFDSKIKSTVCCAEHAKKGSIVGYLLSIFILTLVALFSFLLIKCYRRRQSKQQSNSNCSLFANIETRAHPTGIRYASICDTYNINGNF